MPKAVPPLAAAPSTPLASNSKAPLAVPPLQTDTTAPTVAVLDYGGPKKRGAERMTNDKWPQPTEYRSWNISFNLRSLSFFAIQGPRLALGHFYYGPFLPLCFGNRRYVPGICRKEKESPKTIIKILNFGAFLIIKTFQQPQMFAHFTPTQNH